MKLLVLIAPILYCQLVSASSIEEICLNEKCEEVRGESINGFLELKTDKERIKFLESFALRSGLSKFKILKSIQENNTVYKLAMTKENKYKIVNLKVKNDFEIEGVRNLLNIEAGDPIDLNYLNQNLLNIREFMRKQGCIGVKTLYYFDGYNNNLRINVNVEYENIIKISDVVFKGNNNLPRSIADQFLAYKGNNFNEDDINIQLERTKQYLFSRGFYQSKVILEFKTGNDLNSKVIVLNVDLGRKLNFSFKGNKSISKYQILRELRNSIHKNDKRVDREILESIIIKIYEERGFYRSEVFITERKGVYKNGPEFLNFYINIKEGNKLKIVELEFKGISEVHRKNLKNLFYQNATPLILSNYLDRTYVDEFKNDIKNYLLEDGYIAPIINVSTTSMRLSKQGLKISYDIRPKWQCIVDDIKLINVNTELSLLILKGMKNSVGKPLNVVNIESDLIYALNIIQREGYFFAKIKNFSQKNIVRYKAGYKKADIVIEFDLKDKIIFNSLIISGNKKTQNSVIERENRFQKGDIVTPEKLNELEERIISLDIFSDVKIIPRKVENTFLSKGISKVDLFIEVKEESFGIGELAPGFRTDLGVKVSFDIAYKNVWGQNHSISLKNQINRRFSLSELDSRRRNLNHHRIEGLMRLRYNWPYLTRFFDGSMNLSFQRRRFSSFDADVWQISPEINKKFTSFFTSSLAYRFERIRQFDATEIKDQETFKIGGIVPSLQLDFRDDPIVPRSGAFFSLSWEFANPFFLSKSDEKSEINFSKIVSRNRFYYPLLDKILVLALSANGGYQINYADRAILDDSGRPETNSDGGLKTVGYIPSIKVFRLDGFDSMRGFSDSEANRLSNGRDINELRIQGPAYFTNLKFEPRYYLNDSVVLGGFLDVGGLYVDSFRPLDFRSSVGVSLKFLTPVGSLDFDYGVKTKREYLSDGTRENFGRFHLFIGFF